LSLPATTLSNWQKERWLLKVALVHDYLTQYGGAERVLEQLKMIYPDAPVFTSFVDFNALPVHFRDWEIHATPANHLPGAVRYHRALLPAYPAIFRGYRGALREFDVVLADSSAWAHHAAGSAAAANVCYCHSPARFLYGDQNYLGPARVPGPAKAVLPGVLRGLRALDQRAAARVDCYIANSATVASRIQSAYGRDAKVVFPPVDVERFAPDGARSKPEPWYLVVSRVVPHKRVDLVVEACTRANIPLKVIGDGRSLEALRRSAGPMVELLGWQPDEVVVDHLRRCQALVLPAVEDFGMTAVEAQAAGRPVIALAAGGALETVIDGETGVFFREQDSESLIAAIERAAVISWNPGLAVENASRFAPERFRREIAEVVEEVARTKRSSRNHEPPRL
jgi:glycosyltransferase involved in cell wall biosynthesis